MQQRKGQLPADPVMKRTIQELLQRMREGILQPKFCHYKDDEARIEFAVICHIFKATSEEARAKVAACVRDLYKEGQFYDKGEWIKDGEGDVVYTYPEYLFVPRE